MQSWYNTTLHSAIKVTPFEALFGYKPPVLPAIGGGSEVATVEEYLQKKREVAQQMRQELASA